MNSDEKLLKEGLNVISLSPFALADRFEDIPNVDVEDLKDIILDLIKIEFKDINSKVAEMQKEF